MSASQILARSIRSGSGSPEGAVSGNVGDLYTRTSDGTTWVKSTGAGTNTGWAQTGGAQPFAWQGTWDIGTAYATDDVVEHDGSSYIATETTTAGDEPGVSAKWDLVVEKGDPGASGADASLTYLTVSDETGTLTGSRRLVAGTNVTFDDSVSGVRTISASGGGGGSESEGVVYKAADTSRNSTTTLTDDPDLTFSVDASSFYFVELYTLWTESASGAADYKLGWSYPSGTLVRWGGPNGTNQAWGTIAVGSSPSIINQELTTVSSGAHSGGGLSGIAFHAIVITDVTAGTFAFQWAQNTTNASNVTLKAGSFMRYRKLNA